MQRFKQAVQMLAAALMVASTAQAGELWRQGGLKTPESALYDRDHQRLIVSNMNGGPADHDGNGYLSLLSLDGKVLNAQWATGMDAPKGLAIFGGRVFVADITHFRVVDANTGRILQTLTPDGAVFLNDVTVDAAGRVYVTDMMTNAIYRYQDGSIDLWLRDERLASPNGILADGDRLIVGSWGKGIRADFSTEVPGGLLSVDVASRSITPLPGAERLGNIDGIVMTRSGLVVTDYLAGLVWRYRPGSAPEKIKSLKAGSADLGSDGTTLFVPMMNEGEVLAFTPD